MRGFIVIYSYCVKMYIRLVCCCWQNSLSLSPSPLLLFGEREDLLRLLREENAVVGRRRPVALPAVERRLARADRAAVVAVLVAQQARVVAVATRARLGLEGGVKLGEASLLVAQRPRRHRVEASEVAVADETVPARVDVGELLGEGEEGRARAGERLAQDALGGAGVHEGIHLYMAVAAQTC